MRTVLRQAQDERISRAFSVRGELVEPPFDTVSKAARAQSSPGLLLRRFHPDSADLVLGNFGRGVVGGIGQEVGRGHLAGRRQGPPGRREEHQDGQFLGDGVESVLDPLTHVNYRAGCNRPVLVSNPDHATALYHVVDFIFGVWLLRIGLTCGQNV